MKAARGSGKAEQEIVEEFVQSAQWKIGARTNASGRAMAEQPTNDQELLRQLAKGNEAAFNAAYERYQGPIYRFVLHMSGNAATAEEITQEAFMVLIGNPKGYDPAKGTVAGYLFGIARNLTRRALEQRRHDVPIMDDGAESGLAFASDLDQLEELSQTEQLDLLRSAVLALPEQYRETVVLCELEEMSYDRAAEILECAPGTVASRLNRARAMLKAKLSREKCVR
jgi:RNA polymerase sigma-70 factor (ECF subfamily)